MIMGSWRALRSGLAGWTDTHIATRLLRALLIEIEKDDVFGMAAEMAYRFLFAIFPMLLLLVTALGFAGDAFGFNRLFEDLMGYAGPFLPPPVARIVEQYVGSLLDTRSSAFLTVGLIGTLWGAAGGVGTLIKGLNRAYDVEQPRPFWRRQLLSIAVTVTLPPMALVLLVLAVLGRSLATWLGDGFNMGREMAGTLALVRWPVLVLLLVVGLSLIYHVLPHKRHRYLWSLPGSALATVGWLLLARAFGLYVENFGHYDSTYGGFGAAIAFLLWLYLVGVVVLLGAEINGLLEPAERRSWSSRRTPAEMPDSGALISPPGPKP